MDGVQWDDANRTHVGRHGTTPEEVNEALTLDPADLGHSYEQGESRYSYVGSTVGGRILVVVVTERGNLLRPVTAFEAGAYLRKQFLQSRLST